MKYGFKVLVAIILVTSSTMQANINNATIPLLIDSPGSYQLVEDILYSATSNTPAVIVAVNDVTINFRDLSITQADGFGYSVTCIQIAPSISNVSIKGGTIKNFTQSGISLAQGDQFTVIDDMTINMCGKRCIECIGTVATPIVQTEVLNSTFINSCTVATADNVITFSNCTDTEMSDCIISTNGNFSMTGTFVGVKLTNAARYIFKEVGISSSKGNSDLRGFSLNNSSGGRFDSCRASSGQAAGATSTSRGFYLENNSTLNFIDNCIAFGFIGNIVDGFLTDTGCNGNMYTNCLGGGNVATGATGTTHGYRSINNTKTTFKNCESRGNTAGTSTVSPYGSYGFKFDTVTLGSLISCISYFNAAPLGSSVGIYAIQSTSCIFRDNQSSSNKQGFDFQGTFTQNTFVKNISERNTNSSQYTGFPSTAVSDNIWSSSIEIISGPWTNIGIS